MKAKVSIIVPAYNSEEYIEKCIDTVANQTYKNIEMLVINDGSTDKTLQVLNNMQKKYNWIRIINIENHGQGYARNLGVREASGDYILFLDSDDLLKPETLEKTVNKIENEKADLVMFDWMRYSDKNKKYRKAAQKSFFKYSQLEGPECLNILKLKAYYSVASLYSKEFLLNNKIEFAEGHIYEDNVFIVKVATRAKKISIIQDPLYIVVSNEKSDTKTKYNTDKHCKAYISAVSECIEALTTSIYKPSEYYSYYIYALNKFYTYYIKRTPNKEKNSFLCQFVDIMSSQDIDFSEHEGESKLLEYIVNNNIYKNKDYKQFKNIIIEKRAHVFLHKISKKFKKISKILKKLRRVLIKDWYLRNTRKKILENYVFVQSKNGSDLAGNMFYIAKEINDNYRNFKIYLACTDESKRKIKSMLNKYQLKRVKLINIRTLKFLKLIARTKYIFTDTSVSSVYIKRKGQILVNTWHGTPLKKMGRDVPYRLYDCWNVQKNFIIADYLLYPNKFMEKIMLNSYGIRNITNAKVLNAGYPRNAIFFNEDRRNVIREAENLSDKQISVYMPTWRGIMTQKENQRQIEEIKGFFDEIDKLLNDNQILYIKLHVYVKSGIDCSKYKHIREFPSGYETYDFLNIADILITDYSSVFFDFANSRKKIILFAYDEADYFAQRGFYIDYHKDLPFEKVYTPQELVNAMNNNKNECYNDFIKYYCEFDEKDAPKHLCEFLIEGKGSDKIHVDAKFGKNDKKNIGVYVNKPSVFETIDTYLDILSKIDINEKNYTFFVDQNILKNHVDFVEKIPSEVSVLPYKKNKISTLGEVITKRINKKKQKEINNKIYEREAKRRFGEFKFDNIINISEDKDIALLFKNLSKTTVKTSL